MRACVLIAILSLVGYTARTQSTIEVQLVDVVILASPQAYTHVHMVLDNFGISNTGPGMDRVFFKTDLPATFYSTYHPSTPSPLVMMDFNYVSVYNSGTGYYKDATSIPFTYYTYDWTTQSCNWQNFEITSGGMKFIFRVKMTPYLTMINLVQTSYCEDEKVTISASHDSALSGYIWEFSDGSGPSWKPFVIPPTNPTSSSVQVGLNNLYGNGDNSGKFNTAIMFSVRVGSCSRMPITQSVKFFAIQPVITSSVPVDPQCRGGTGSYTINAFNRNTRAGEVFKVTVQDVADIGNLGSKDLITTSGLPVTINGLSPGTFEVIVEATVGGVNSSCGAVAVTGTFTLTDPTQVIFSENMIVPPSCPDNTTGIKNDGKISIAASGGTDNTFEYKIGSDAFIPMGGKTFTITGLMKGKHFLQVRDQNLCVSAVKEIEIFPVGDMIIPFPAIAQYNGSDIKCSGGSDGQVTIGGVTGGTPGYQYSKDGTNYQGNVFNGLSAGGYTFTVKDSKGCTASSSVVTLTAPPVITATATPTATTCFAVADGKVSLSASGGTSPYTYSKDGTSYQAATLFEGLPGGLYTLSIKDKNDCVITRTATVIQPAEISVNPVLTMVDCAGGETGAVIINAANGVGDYDYSFGGGPFGTQRIFTGLTATNYSIVVRDDNNCTKTTSATITSNPPITGSIIPTVVSCNGGTNGSLNLTPSGGVSPYTYSWSNGPTTKDLTGLPAGSYTVTITDSKGCTNPSVISQLVGQPSPISVDYAVSDYNGQNIPCFGNTNGSINITTAGGNGGYTYSWSNSSTTEDLSNLPAGTYTVTVKDSKNCPGSQTIILTQPDALVTTLNTKQNVLCFGGTTGSITLTTTGGTGTAEYSMNSGTTWQTVPTFTSLAANTYTILTRDINNCQASFGTSITSPSEIILSVDNITSTTCNQSNGSATTITTGGIPGYTYQWFNSSNASVGNTANINSLPADTYKVIVTDQNLCSKQELVPISSSNGPQLSIGPGTPATCFDTADGSGSIHITGGSAPYTILWPDNQTTLTATNLAGGEYIVEVRDNTNCLALTTVTIDSPPELIINTINKKNPNCTGNSDGAITLEATGGNGTYAYSWNTGSTSPALTNIPAGTYTLTVKDIKNCTEEEQIILLDPPLFTIDLGADQKICEGMTAPLSVAENNATYFWTSDNGFTSADQNVQLTAAGIYTVTVINAKGCEATDSFQLSYDVNLLKADFLMTSEAHAGDTIVLIDISWPLPETVTWGYDEAATVIEETADFSMVRFDDPGEYNINLLARLAQCSNRSEQSITILEAAVMEEEQGRTSERLIETVSAYPNPSADEVSVSIALSKSKTINLELYQAETNKRIYQEELARERAYIKALNLSTLPRGMYILYVRAGKEIRTIKIVKK